MATRKKKVEEIEIQAEEVIVNEPTFEKQTYEVLAQKWQVGNKIYKRGDKIDLTKEAYKFYQKQFKVK